MEILQLYYILVICLLFREVADIICLELTDKALLFVEMKKIAQNVSYCTKHFNK